MAPFKSSKGRNLGKLIKSYLTSSIGEEIGQDGGDLVSGPIEASGGVKYTPGNGFIYHMITAPAGVVNFVVSSGGDLVDILIVGGGGGGGGGYYAGGGGAGQVVEGTNVPIQPGTYLTYAGFGGAGGVAQVTAANQGAFSNFDGILALGGGRGGSGPGINNDGGDGGSGGGSSYYVASGVGTSLPFSSQTDPRAPLFVAYGNDAAESRQPGVVGAGGGGAGAPGGGSPSTGVNGGDGKPMARWPSTQIPGLAPFAPFMGPLYDTYGGGGGAGPGGPGGVGGGANGGGANPGSPAPSFLGGGGGGSSGSSTNNGGDGGPGIVLIRYSAPS